MKMKSQCTKDDANDNSSDYFILLFQKLGHEVTEHKTKQRYYSVQILSLERKEKQLFNRFLTSVVFCFLYLSIAIENGLFSSKTSFSSCLHPNCM